MVGGYVFSIICVIFYIKFADTYLMNKTEISIKIFAITVIISTVSQIGDLVISYFKRLSKIKDTGNLIHVWWSSR